MKAFFLTLLLVGALGNALFGQVAEKVACGSFYEVNDSIYRKHLQIIKKLYLGESIQEKNYPGNTVVFYFQTGQAQAVKSAAMIVLDSNYRAVDGYRFPSCCDFTAFYKKEKIKKKVMKKLQQICFIKDAKQRTFYEFRCPNSHDFMEVLYILEDKKIRSGLLVEGGVEVSLETYKNNALPQMLVLLRGG